MQAPLKPADRQAIRDWESYISNFVSTVVADRNESLPDQKKRVARLEASFEEWKQYYFPNYCYAPAAKFHKSASKACLENPEYYEVRAWARELAKDVVVMIETIYQVLTKRKKNILLISNSYDKAEKLILPYKVNLEKNERIIHDYGVQENAGKWQAGDFITTGGASFLAIGAGQSPRGSRNEEVRPDKVIVSDMDTDEDCRNEEIINKRWEWFERAVYGTRSVSKNFQVVWLGNIIAKDCCVVRATKKADRVSKVNIVDKDGNSSWPEKNTKEHIERIRSKISAGAFEQEYMNNPISEGKVFKKITWGKCPPLFQLRYVVAYADPSPSNRENKTNSSKALFIIGEKAGKFYVYNGWLQQTTAEKFVNWFFDARDYVAGKTQINFYIENNSLQDPFFQQVFMPLFVQIGETRGHLPITPDERKKPDKFTRIEGNLEPLVRNGQLIFNEAEANNPNMQALEEQFLMVDSRLSAPADGPDDIEGGVFIINQKKINNADNYVVKSRGVSKKY